MVMKHQRLNMLARHLRRCPECGAWFALQKKVTDKGIAGIKNKYTCTKCSTIINDWKPTDRVKF